MDGNGVPECASLRVLVAEDNELNQKVMVGYLDYLGHSSTVCRNGLEALAKLGTDEFDVALLDIQMPEMDGMTVATEARALNDAVPFLVATTGMVRADGAVFYRSNGFDAYLEKPVPLERLAALLRAIPPRPR